MKQNLKGAMSTVGLLMIMISLGFPLFGMNFMVTRIVFAVGAALNVGARLWQQSDWRDLPLRAKRLHRMELWSGLFFVVAAALMWIRQSGAYDWVAFTLAGAVIVIYASLALPSAMRK